MAEEKRSVQKKIGELTRSLPRNYRQIGGPGAKKIYIEDYVYTYLNKLAQPENLYARGAVLFGKMYKDINWKMYLYKWGGSLSEF